ncbi:MAG: CAP domain-containing protein [Oscillospiraceae bacterium]|nr:CAP domain-containing protein [Oscillospiraceae bacterium]
MGRLSKKVLALILAVALFGLVMITASINNVQAFDDPYEPSLSTEDIARFAAEVVRLVNVERAKVGLPALSTNLQLTAAAQLRATELLDLFDHRRPNGSYAETALDEFGISYYNYGENIARGQMSAAAVVNAWMDSPGHRGNILNTSYNFIGVGLSINSAPLDGTPSWVQLFAASNSLTADPPFTDPGVGGGTNTVRLQPNGGSVTPTSIKVDQWQDLQQPAHTNSCESYL